MLSSRLMNMPEVPTPTISPKFRCTLSMAVVYRFTHLSIVGLSDAMHNGKGPEIAN